MSNKVQDNVKLKKNKKSLQMQVLWHTMKERRGRLSLSGPDVPTFKRTKSTDYLYHWLQEKKKIKSSSTQKKATALLVL